MCHTHTHMHTQTTQPTNQPEIKKNGEQKKSESHTKIENYDTYRRHSKRNIQ